MLVGNTRLVENTREDALKAFLNGSDVRVVIDTAEGNARFLDLRKLLPLDAVYLIRVEIKPEDDYEEKVFGTNPEKVPSSTEQEVSVTERKPPETKTKPLVAERKPKATAKPKTEKKARPKQKTAADIIEPYVRQGFTDSEIAEKTGIKYGTVWNAAKKIREKLEETKGKNADRHLCKTCQYRARGYSEKSGDPKCDYTLITGHSRDGGRTWPDDCDKYVEGKRIKARKNVEE